MNSVIDYLSGEIPGGILILLLILFIINLTLFFFYKGSKLYTKKEYTSKVFKSSIFIISSYIILWFLLKPTPIPNSILFLPFQNNQVADYRISEILEKQIDKNMSDDYRIHYWDWFYQSSVKDSIDNFDYRLSVANRLKVQIIISGEYISESILNVFVQNENHKLNKEFDFRSYSELSNKILKWLDENYQILNENNIAESNLTDKNLERLCKSKILYLDKDYNTALSLIAELNTDPVLISKIYLSLGKNELKNIKKSNFEKEENKFFIKIVNLLIPIAQEGNDSAELNRILGELYLFEEKYKQAEIFLKKALTQNPNDARIYYDFYFLHQDRFKDLGFEDRFEVLKKAITLDNGYSNAVFELANEYFQTGTGSKSGTGATFAMETLNNFMKINSNDKKILLLLAGINLQIKHAEDAIEIYNKLISRGNTESEIYYNLGIGYFHLKNYDEAKKAFLTSISKNEYPDSYLYMGAINKILGNYDEALFYYRERIKRSKIREDDYYANEARHGLRWILKKQYDDSVKDSLKMDLN